MSKAQTPVMTEVELIGGPFCGEVTEVKLYMRKTLPPGLFRSWAPCGAFYWHRGHLTSSGRPAYEHDSTGQGK